MPYHKVVLAHSIGDSIESFPEGIGEKGDRDGVGGGNVQKLNVGGLTR